MYIAFPSSIQVLNFASKRLKRTTVECLDGKSSLLGAQFIKDSLHAYAYHTRELDSVEMVFSFLEWCFLFREQRVCSFERCVCNCQWGGCYIHCGTIHRCNVGFFSVSDTVSPACRSSPICFRYVFRAQFQN